MGLDPSTILHSKWVPYVAPSMIGRQWVGGVLINLKLLVFNMFGRKSWDGQNLGQNRSTVDRSDHPINDEVAPSPREVQDHEVAMASVIIMSQAPVFLHDGGFGDTRLFHDPAKGLDEPMVHQMPCPAIRTTCNMPLKGFRSGRW